MSGLGEQLKKNMAELIPNAFSENEMESVSIKKELSDEQKKSLSEYWEKVSAPISYKEFTAEQLFENMEKAPSIIIDENNRRVIKILCMYFTNDPRFEQQLDGNLNKGLMLRGGIGIGKTYLMNLFRMNQKQGYSLRNCGEIASQYTLEGRELLSQYTAPKETVPSQRNYGQDKSGICFDDLGCEKEGIHYADKVEILAPIIEMRYTRGLHTMTHITTNLPPEEIDRRYGARLRSRMREMFNVIDFPDTATDRRK
jgi:hypothetical protein